MKLPPYPTFDHKRPLSWSAISSFEWDPEQWYRKYVWHKDCHRGSISNGKEIISFCAISMKENDHSCPAIETSIEMTFGKVVGERLAADPDYLPHVKRYPIFEHGMECTFSKIPLIGYADGWAPLVFNLGEYKTGKKKWDQKRADDHGQITMYCLMLFIIDKIPPESIVSDLHWLPTQDNNDFSISFIDENDVRTFHTRRTMRDILAFGSRIISTYSAMEEYCKSHI